MRFIKTIAKTISLPLNHKMRAVDTSAIMVNTAAIRKLMSIFSADSQ
jgi:hypothetical protein